MNDEALRARVRSAVALAFDAVPPVWPLAGFIATNPLGGFEHQPFRDAVAEAHVRTGARGFMSEAYYRRLYASGQIGRDALEAALARATAGLVDPPRTLYGRTLATRDLLWLSLTNELTRRERRTALDVAVDARLRALPETAPVGQRAEQTVAKRRVLAMSELVDRCCGTNLVELIDEATIRWCGAFLDRGEAAWTMPYRECGFYTAWRRLAPHDPSPTARAIDGYRRCIQDALAHPEDAVVAALSAMGIGRAAWRAYLERHALALPGWSGLVKWRAQTPWASTQVSESIDPVQYLAVRLWYEQALVATVARRHALAPTAAAFQDRFQPDASAGTADARMVLANLATALELSETEVLALEDDDVHWLLAALHALDRNARGLLWLRAHEQTVRAQLLQALPAATSTAAPLRDDAASLRADVTFCIDVRSEGYRRHLEALGPYRTRGFAGFSGLPMSLRGLDAAASRQACPVLLTPKHEVVERPSDVPAPASARRGHTFLLGAARLLDRLKGSVGAPFVLFEALGGLFVLPLAGRTLAPRSFAHWRKRLARAIAPRIRTELVFDKQLDDPTVGFTLAEQLFFAEAALALMNLRHDVARLVVLVGHGSTTENNPFEASLDCGACAGYRGGPNARVLAAILNRPEIRAGLRERAIILPDATLFVAGEHDTATDRIALADLHLVPRARRGELAQLQADLDLAGARLAAERATALEGPALESPGLAASASLVARRSTDWAQIRPEWGLARNAAFIIGPRAFTAGADLGSRAFLHEYDVDGDREGTLLEIIMTAPLVVAQWINNHYYFATVDNARYGSGTKVIHNVVGRIGVVCGNGGDLRPGLPVQSLADRAGWYHEPLRLLAVVTAPRARIDAVIARNAILQRLFHNEWIALAAWDPETQSLWEYEDAVWRPSRLARRTPEPEIPGDVRAHAVQRGGAHVG